MDQRQGRRKLRIAQIRIEEWQLIRRQHAFVDNRSTRQTGDVEHTPLVNPSFSRPGDPLAYHAELALERDIVRKALLPTDKELTDGRLRGSGSFSQRFVISGYSPPAKYALPFFNRDLLEQMFTLATAFFFRGQEDHADSILARRR